MKRTVVSLVDIVGEGGNDLLNACGVMLQAGLLQAASAPYAEWQHPGSIWLLTTPDGANLPASASEEGFPVLVRRDNGAKY